MLLFLIGLNSGGEQYTWNSSHVISLLVITPSDLIAFVTALTVGLRAQAQVIGINIFYNQFTHRVTKNTYKTIVPVLIIAGLDTVESITGFITRLVAVPYEELAKTVPGLVGDKVLFEMGRRAEMECFKRAVDWVFLLTVLFGVVACVAAACMGDVERFMDGHVAVPLG